MSTDATRPYDNPADMKTRQEVLQQDRAASTYLDQARSSIAELGGRFALGRETTVVGARPLELDTSQDGHSARALERQRGRLPVYPVHPAHPFAVDAPTEPPLGIDVNAVKDVSKV